MVFWRKKKNEAAQERQENEKPSVSHADEVALDKAVTPEVEPEVEPEVKPETEIDATEIPDTQEAEVNTVETQDDNSVSESDIKDEELNNDALESASENAQDSPPEKSQEGGWLSRLSKGLSKSSSKLGKGIADTFTKRKLDQDALEDLEDILIMADMGPKTASKIVAEFSKEKFDKEVDADSVSKSLATSIANILDPVALPLDITPHTEGEPFVLLVCGVNGAGKTTTIGKLAHEYHLNQGKKVMIAAADTFRAAAVDQLDVWAERAQCPIIKKDIGADPAAVAFEGIEKARAEKADLLMIDTAGRLQNKSNLMAELEKIIRVIKKQDESAPHGVLLVLDSTTGQNAHSQLQTFKEIVGVTGLIVTKLDGSAKGGVVVSLAEEFGMPIHAIGVGEKIEDLRPFKSQDFANALVGVE